MVLYKRGQHDTRKTTSTYASQVSLSDTKEYRHSVMPQI